MTRPRTIHTDFDTPETPFRIGLKILKCKRHPGYAVDSIGRVWSCKIERCSGFGEWHIIKSCRTKHGRLRVNIRTNGNRHVCLVHHLVAEAFLGPRPHGKYVLHKDGNHNNNAASNLYYGTQSENMKDAIRHGTHNWCRRSNV